MVRVGFDPILALPTTEVHPLVHVPAPVQQAHAEATRIHRQRRVNGELRAEERHRPILDRTNARSVQLLVHLTRDGAQTFERVLVGGRVQ